MPTMPLLVMRVSSTYIGSMMHLEKVEAQKVVGSTSQEVSP